MSIVINAVIKNEILLIASDLRAVKNGVVQDNFKKIFKIRPCCFYSITGIAEAGIWFLDRIKKNSGLSVADLLKWADVDFDLHKFPTLTITFSGKDERGNFFIWQKNNSGQKHMPMIEPSGITYTLSANDNIPIFAECFEEFVLKLPLNEAISRTIEYAATIDTSISKEHEIIVVK
jgi:hypothetical protein